MASFFDKEKLLKIANGVLSTTTPNESFIQIANKYKALATQIKSKEQINQWTAEQTENKITDVITSIDNIQMIMLSSMFYRYQWLYPFIASDTRKGEFHNKDGTISQIDMLFEKDYTDYIWTENYQAIELSLVDTKTCAVILLPSKTTSIDQFVNKLNDNMLNFILNNLHWERVRFTLPKFEISYNTSLKDSLIQLGMKKPFESKADFSAITDHKTLKLDDMIHKTYLKVDEEGTEQTLNPKQRDYMWPTTKPDAIMTVDRPFIFIIRNKNLGNDHLIMLSKIEQL